jgi:hypothetical protein
MKYVFVANVSLLYLLSAASSLFFIPPSGVLRPVISKAMDENSRRGLWNLLQNNGGDWIERDWIEK